VIGRHACGGGDRVDTFGRIYGPKCDADGKYLRRPTPTAKTVERFLCSFGRGKRCNHPNCKAEPDYTAIAIVNGPGDLAANGTMVVLDACREHHSKIADRAARSALRRELTAWREGDR
jgi:hypothetical protein